MKRYTQQQRIGKRLSDQHKILIKENVNMGEVKNERGENQHGKKV